MNLKQQLKRARRFARPVLVDHFGLAAADPLLDQMVAIYDELQPRIPILNNGTNRMLLRLAVDTLAFYRALPDSLAQDERLQLAQAFVNNWMEGQFESWVARRVYANQTLHLLYRRWWFRRVNRADEPAGWRYVLQPPADGLYYGLNVVRCGAVRYLVQEGVPELAPILCRGDFQIEKYLPPGITFARQGVIAEGADRCDFRYVYDVGRET